MSLLGLICNAKCSRRPRSCACRSRKLLVSENWCFVPEDSWMCMLFAWCTKPIIIPSNQCFKKWKWLHVWCAGPSFASGWWVYNTKIPTDHRKWDENFYMILITGIGSRMSITHISMKISCYILADFWKLEIIWSFYDFHVISWKSSGHDSDMLLKPVVSPRP